MGKKLRKGTSQDALGGLNMPEAAGIFATTGTPRRLRGDLGSEARGQPRADQAGVQI